MAEDRIYKVIFHGQGQVYEVFARSVSQGELFGFIEIEQLLFGERSSVVIDPSEESLRNEFKGVERVFVPLHAVVRIDEVTKSDAGRGRVTAARKGDGTVTAFPGTVYGKPGKEPDKS